MNEKLDSIRSEFYSIGVFGGQERFVKYDLNAFAEMERMYGSMEAANEALTKGSMNDVRRILWLGLIHDQAILDEVTGEPIKYKLTLYEVGSWLTPSNMKSVMEKLNKAISGAIPDDAAATTPTGVTPAQALALAKAEEEDKTTGKVTPFTNPN